MKMRRLVVREKARLSSSTHGIQQPSGKSCAFAGLRVEDSACRFRNYDVIIESQVRPFGAAVIYGDGSPDNQVAAAAGSFAESPEDKGIICSS